MCDELPDLSKDKAIKQLKKHFGYYNPCLEEFFGQEITSRERVDSLILDMRSEDFKELVEELDL